VQRYTGKSGYLAQLFAEIAHSIKTKIQNLCCVEFVMAKSV